MSERHFFLVIQSETFELRLGYRGEQTLISQPLLQQDGPEIQRSEARSQPAAVLPMAEDMQLRRYSGGN
jgi:hypothetical protein